jgi:hypothetical protein
MLCGPVCLDYLVYWWCMALSFLSSTQAEMLSKEDSLLSVMVCCDGLSCGLSSIARNNPVSNVGPHQHVVLI